jgi:hypothetical protein
MWISDATKKPEPRTAVRKAWDSSIFRSPMATPAQASRAPPPSMRGDVIIPSDKCMGQVIVQECEEVYHDQQKRWPSNGTDPIITLGSLDRIVWPERE